MYAAYIIEEPKADVYENLINYAFNKSDAIMVVIYRYDSEVSDRHKIATEQEFDDEKIYHQYLDYLDKLRKDKEINHIIFKETTEVFIKELEPYLIKRRNSPREWPSSKVIFNEGANVDICVYRACEEIKKFILKPDGLFQWKYPTYPDDLCFFKDGICWFFTVAHEGYAYIYLKDISEVKALGQLGIRYTLEECKDDKKSLFYEDYKL